MMIITEQLRESIKRKHRRKYWNGERYWDREELDRALVKRWDRELERDLEQVDMIERFAQDLDQY